MYTAATSDRSQVNAGVPQSTLVGPVSFMFHISDLQTVANDTSSMVCGK